MLESLLASERPGPAESELNAEPGQPELWEGLTILDLYAGTGALGIEALSRGAAWSDFVEVDAAARRVIERNLRSTGLGSRSKVLGLDVTKVLQGSTRSALHRPYSVVLLDPPYAAPEVGSVLNRLASAQILAPGALVGVEHSKTIDLADRYPTTERSDGAPEATLEQVRVRRHGDTALSIYRWITADARGEEIDGHQGDLSGQL